MVVDFRRYESDAVDNWVETSVVFCFVVLILCTGVIKVIISSRIRSNAIIFFFIYFPNLSNHVIIYNIYVVLNYLINNLTLCQLIPLVYHSEKEDAGVFECKSLFICLVLGLFCDVLMIQYHTLR